MIVGTTKKSDLKEKLNRFREGFARDLTNALKVAAPVDSGRLRSSIKYRIVGKTIEIYMVDYALYVEFGTAPHIIKPKNAKALHWNSGGKDVFASIVHHPGTMAQPFIRNTLRSRFKELMRENLVRAFV